jgi:hypothetical protein
MVCMRSVRVGAEMVVKGRNRAGVRVSASACTHRMFTKRGTITISMRVRHDASASRGSPDPADEGHRARLNTILPNTKLRIK